MKDTTKKNIAVIFGGYSAEYIVSLESASAVIKNLNREKYQPVLIGISRSGDWYYYNGPVESIHNNSWCCEKYCTPAVISPNRSCRDLIILDPSGTYRISVDAALPILHGKNGEDGSVQGLFSLSGIPLAGCGILASAVCMDKDLAHKLVSLTGIRVPVSKVINISSSLESAEAFAEQTGLPLFVKPVKAGSSFGITKIFKKSQLNDAIEKAFMYDDQVILEENIEGFEVGCAVLGNKQLITGEPDEIQLSSGFFDFTEKYTLKTSSIHVPARITSSKISEIKETANVIYKTLGCRGFARVDMFLTPDGEIIFNEVNTIPGFTEHSRYPAMMKAAGLTFEEMLDKILKQAVI